MPERAAEVLGFWFGDGIGPDASLARHERRWFDAPPAYDKAIRDRFADLIRSGGAGELEDWAHTPRGRLALIVLLDQFPRSAFRGSAEAYAYDAHARTICLRGLAAGADRELAPIERLFFYLPLMHSEFRADQRQSVACFDALFAAAKPRNAPFFAGWARRARRQRVIIALFGRFPRRNAPLRRVPRIGERLFLRVCATLAKLKWID